MVGLIQKIMVKTVRDLGGEEAIFELGRRTQIDLQGGFQMSVAYSDEEWQRLFTAACEVLGQSRQDVIEAFSDRFMADAIARWPKWFAMAKNSRDFLKLQPLIHNSFASVVGDGEQRRKVEDKFRLEETGDIVTVHYKSVNKLCDLYLALAARVARHYGDEIEIEMPLCMRRGDPKTEFRIRFVKLAGQPSTDAASGTGQ